MANNLTVTRVTSTEEMAQTAARRFALICETTIKTRGVCSVALSGGNTSKRLYEILGQQPYVGKIAWDKITFLLGDERLVPIDNKDSNFLMIKNTLLHNAPIKEENLLRVYTDLGTAGASAGDYDLTIRKHLNVKEGEFPAIDFVLLGMGPDGHTASLFPGTDALKNTTNIACANYVAKFKSWRVTLTAPVLRNAKNILLQVSGTDKADALKQVLEGDLQETLYPSQLLRGMKGKVEWLVDEQSSANLRQSLSNSSSSSMTKS